MKTLRPLISSLLGGAFCLLLGACASTPSPSPTPRLYAFDCGHIDVLDISVFHPGVGKGEHKTLTDSCYLIVHPKGTLIWDTGLPDALAAVPEGKSLYGVFNMKVKTTLASQLKQIGVAPESITYMGISHMHGDHIGNANLFPKATLLMQKEEYEAAFGAEPGKFGFDPTGYPTLGANPNKLLQGDYDVFGDDSVVIKRTLGHTPGHQALFLRLAKTGNVLLSGDLVHFTENWEKRYVPGFNFDKPQSLKTMDEVAGFLKDNQAQLWIQHDLEQNATIKHAPAFYD